MDFDVTIKKIAELVEHNEHTRAYIEGSQLLNMPELFNAFNKIQDIQEIKGYLDFELAEQRFLLCREMMDGAEYLLTKDFFKRFYDSF